MSQEVSKTFFGTINPFPEPSDVLFVQEEKNSTITAAVEEVVEDYEKLKTAADDNGEVDTQQKKCDRSSTDSSCEYLIKHVLDASIELLPFFDFFGAFIKFSKTDFEGNINKLRRRGADSPDAKTFRQLLQYELDHKLSKKKDSACIVAVWFKRGLQFIVALMDGFVQSPDATTTEVVKVAYEATLKKHHNWVVQKSVTVAAKVAPPMPVVLKKLCYGNEALKDQLMSEQKKYLLRLRPVVNHLHNLVIDLGLDKEEHISE